TRRLRCGPARHALMRRAERRGLADFRRRRLGKGDGAPRGSRRGRRGGERRRLHRDRRQRHRARRLARDARGARAPALSGARTRARRIPGISRRSHDLISGQTAWPRACPVRAPDGRYDGGMARRMATTAATARGTRKRDSALWTYQDLLEIPDDRFRYEIIDGDLVVTPSPLSVHQLVSRNLFRILDTYVHAKDRGDVIYAPLDVIFDDLNVLEPDILFVSTERSAIISPRGISAPPDLAVEVLSKGTRRRDLVVKREVY